jgi:hypothetical protein
MEREIHLMIVGDLELIRRELKSRLESQLGWKGVSEVDNHETTIEVATSTCAPSKPIASVS